MQQKSMNLLGVSNNNPTTIPVELIKRCASPQAALRLVCRYDKAKRTQAQIASAMGFKKQGRGTLNKILNADHRIAEGNPNEARYRDHMWSVQLERECGNEIYTGWCRLYESGQLYSQLSTQSKIAAAKAYLAELEANQ